MCTSISLGMPNDGLTVAHVWKLLEMQLSPISVNSIFECVAIRIRSQASYQLDRKKAVEQMSKWKHVQRSTTG